MNRPPISERLYRALLVCYPAEFRQEYGPEMVELFSFRARQENRFLLWLQLLADIAVTAPREHFDVLLQDLRYTLRTLGRAPVFALTAILTLALGTGANTAIFSVVNAVMLRPLPFPQPDRLARIWETNQKLNIQAFSASVPNYVSWREQAKSFSAIGVFGVANLNLTGGGEPERLAAGTLTASMFQAIGLQPILGRGFLEEEERPGRGLVAVLNETLWRRRFESDPKIVGRSVEFNGTARVIVGVFPGEFSFPQGAEVWVPMTIDVARQDRGDHRISAVARLKPGVTLEQADAEMKAIANGLEKTYPQSNLGWSVRMTKFYDWIVPEQVRTTLAVLMGAVGLVLLIACANVANLLLARATSRDREIAMRIALGAGRSRLMRQLLTESTTLALMGGVVGILLAFWAVFGLKQILPASVPRRSEIGVDGLVLAFGLLLSIGTGALFGMAPMWHATRKDLNELLKQNGRTSTASSPVLRNALVVFEIAMVTVLAIGACLLVRSLIQLQQVQLGFNPQHVMTAQISLPPRKYPVAAALAFYQDLLDRLRGGGAAKAAVSSGVPLGAGDFTGTAVWTANEAAPPPNETVEVDWRKVSPEYFEAMGIPLLRGRFFTKQDANGRAVAIVSSQMARRLWGTDDAVGKELHAGGPERLAVVGVVGDVRLFGLSQEPSPVIYFPVPPSCWQTFTVVLRTTGDSSGAASLLRQKVKELDANQPIFNVLSMEQWLNRSAAEPRAYTLLLGLFAGLALVLACVGVYGVLSYSVVQRTSEIGVRVALGARQSQVMGLVMRQGLLLIAAGLGLGIGAAAGSIRLIQGMLFGVSPRDPQTFAGVSLSLLAIALVACLAPAWRASRVDPVVALRAE